MTHMTNADRMSNTRKEIVFDDGTHAFVYPKRALADADLPFKFSLDLTSAKQVIKTDTEIILIMEGLPI